MQRRGVATVEWAALSLLVALFVWRGLLPAWRSVNTDFPNYYLSARLYRDGIPLDRLYDWTWFERQKDHAGVPWGPIGYGLLTPYSALVMVPLAWLPPLAAKRCWLCLNLAMLAVTFGLLRSMCRLPPRRIALLVFATILPLRTNFEFGQQHVLILLLLTWAAWLYARRRDAGAGAAVAVAAVLKLYPALFAAFFALQRRWRALAGLCAGVLVLTVIAVALLGIEPFRVYMVSILPRALGGEGVDPYVGTNSPTSLLRRVFVEEADQNPHPLLSSRAAYAVLQPALQSALLISGLWLTSRPRDPGARGEWGAFVALLLVLSTAISSYHYCVLILATVLGIDRLAASRRIGMAWSLATLHLAVCWPWGGVAAAAHEGWGALLGYSRACAILAYWGVTVATLRPREALRESPRAAMAFAACGSLFLVSGIVSNARRAAVDGEGEHLVLARPALIVTAPAVALSGVYFSRLGRDQWHVDRAGAALTEVPGPDAFAPAVAAGAGLGWLELASLDSRIARFALDAPSLVPLDLPIEVAGAEQPGVSSDGRWLGFIREERGRGSLWIVDRTADHLEHRMIDSERGVLDFAVMDDGRVIFAAQDPQGPGLSVVGPWPDLAQRPVLADRPARYPAVSPDGRWLAFSVEERGAWKLHALDLRSGERRRLTRAPCNVVSPAWSPDGRSLVVASDCGRGVEQASLRRLGFDP